MVAPLRAERPGAAPPLSPERDDATACPFCKRRETLTPPETFALGPEGREPDTPGWRVRVVPNRFPALAGRAGRQEVVVHTPRHARSLAELTPAELADVAAAWAARADAARGAGFPYLHAFVNEGRAAGASLPHTHSQLAWLPAAPPAVAAEAERAGRGCRLCDLLEREQASGARLVAESEGLVLLCPWASRGPYELLVAPLACESDAFGSDLLAGSLVLLAEGTRRLRALRGEVPLNAWLHTGTHWHLELVPRLTVPAGLELGSGIHVNIVPPEAAADALRRSGRSSPAAPA